MSNRLRTLIVATVLLLGSAAVWTLHARKTQQGTAPPTSPAETIAASGRVLGVSIGAPMSEARAKLDPLRAAGEHVADAKEKAGKRIHWKLDGTEYDWVVIWANPKGEVTRIRANLRPDKHKPFGEIGDVARAALNTPQQAVWTEQRPERRSFRLVAQGDKQMASTIYLFALELEMR